MLIWNVFKKISRNNASEEVVIAGRVREKLV